jgi:polyhydroxybutyrate depolymerase
MKIRSKKLINRYLRSAVSAMAIVFVFLISPLALRSGEAIAQSNCATLESQLKRLDSDRARVQKDLQRSAAAEKQSLMEQIKEIDSEIRQKQTELSQNRCQSVVMTWNVAGWKREALVFPPATDMAMKRPLVFAWHGHGGNMHNVGQSMHFQTLWPEAIVVYPQGLDTQTKGDPEGNGPGWQKETTVDNRDLEFFDSMLATLREKYSVDDERVYTTGFSNGTGFSYLLWAERGHKLAAIGAVAGVLAESEHPKLSQPRPLISIAGTSGIAPGAVDNTIERAREVDNAKGTGHQQCPMPNGAPSGTECVLYPSTTHTPVRRMSHPGGHVYPPWAPAEIVKFFKVHHR